MHYAGTRNPRAEYSPLRSMPLFRPAEQVLGWTELQKAEWNLAVAVRDVPLLEQGMASACAALGEANRMTGKQRAMRRFWQAKALRAINVARAQLRAARRKLEAAQLALAALATSRA